MSGRRHMGRPGFTLVEAVIIVLMISIAIPPSISMMVDASDARADRVLLAMTTSYAQAIADQVMADVSAGGLEQLAAPGAYLNDPATGLWTRLSWVSEPYEARGIVADVTVSEMMNWRGEVTGEADQDLFRKVTVTAHVATSNGAVLDVPVWLMVGEPNP